MKASPWAATLILGVALGASSAAADTTKPASTNRWQYVVEPYFIVPTISGTSGVRGITAEVNANASQIISKLNFGAMVFMEAHNPKWAVTVDVLYMDLVQDGTIRSVTVDVGVKQTGIMTSLYRRVAPWAEVSIGANYNSIENSQKGSGPLGIDQSATQSWVDPMIGTRLTLPTTDKWRFRFTGSIGGFGVGSQIAWQVYPEVGYRFTPLFELAGGYRALGMDYTTGSGSDEFVYDLATYGPQLGAMFHF